MMIAWFYYFCIKYLFLTAIDVGKLRQRLNNLAEYKIQTARNLKLIEKMKQPVYLK